MSARLTGTMLESAAPDRAENSIAQEEKPDSDLVRREAEPSGLLPDTAKLLRSRLFSYAAGRDWTMRLVTQSQYIHVTA
jgi:hypothetical protein